MGICENVRKDNVFREFSVLQRIFVFDIILFVSENEVCLSILK